MSDKATYYQEIRGIMLNRAKENYKNNRERLIEQERKNIGYYLKKKRAYRERM